MIRPFSWRVSQFSTRVVIIIIMDHPYNNNNKWRSDAIFSDPRVWINRGSTMDQHGSTWISRLQHAAAVLTHASDSWLMCHASDSWLMRQASDSWLMRQTHGSCVRRQASGVPCVRRPTSHAPCVRRQASHVPCVRRQASGVPCVRRQASHVPRAPFSRRPLSVMTTTGTAAFPPFYPLQICAH